MQEKDIRKQLNQELAEVSPDILQKILAEPKVPLEKEEELLGKESGLFQKKESVRPYAWAAFVAAVLVVAVLAFNFIQGPDNFGGVQNGGINKQMAYSIVIDVNPSIRIDVNKDGKVIRIKNLNQDAKKIVASVNKQMTENMTYEEALKQVIFQLKQNYFKKRKYAMLISVASKKEKNIRGKTSEIKQVTDKIKKEQKISSKTIYQKCVITKEVQKVAKQNRVSVGKAALCIKLAKKKKKTVENLCKEEISTLFDETENSGIFMNDEEEEISSEEAENEETFLELESDVSDETTEESIEESISEIITDVTEESEMITETVESTVFETTVPDYTRIDH